VPAKRAFIAPSIPATITPIKGTVTQCPPSAPANQLKHKKMKPRTIPSGITITRRSPINVASSNSSSNNTNAAATVSNAMANMSNSLATKISAATVAATSKLNSMLSKTTTPSLLKQNIASSISSAKEKQTPAPPRQLPTQQLNPKPQPQQQPPSKQQQPQQFQQGLPLLSQLPQLQPSPSVLRKRLSTAASSPSQQLQAQMQQQQQQLPKLQKSKQQNPPRLQQLLQLDPHARKPSTPPATNKPIPAGPSSTSTSSTSNTALLPLISSVQSMAAGATPPLQLLATPPHSAATTFSDQQLFSPKLMHTTCSLPPSTTVTASRPQSSTSTNTNNSNSFISSNNKNINNNFKIMLPPKSSNSAGINLQSPSTAATPVTTSLAIPVALQQSSSGPRIAYVNSLAAQINPIPSNNAANTTNKPKTSTATVVPIALTAAAQLASMGAPSTSGANTSTSASTNSLASVRRVKPTTLIRKNDEAWLKRTNLSTATTTTGRNFDDDDLVLELLPHSTNTKSHSQMATQLAGAVQNTAKSQKPSAPSLSVPNKPTFASTQKSAVHKPALSLKIDLTESPDKTTTRSVETITISPTISPSTSAQNKPVNLIINGDAATQSTKSSTLNSNDKGKSFDERLPLTSDYDELLKVCREADPSADMEKLVKSKLIKYYYNVHPDFVCSKGFSKNLRTVIANIRKEPDLVYLHLKTVVDELKVRSKNKEAVPTLLVRSEEKSDITACSSGTRDRDRESTAGGGAESGDAVVEEIGSTGNKHTDEQIKKLNKALYILTKRIEVLESTEVDWEDEDSSYLQVERFKKRACQIYEKICDLTGESKNAHRLVKKPIHFNGTTYTQFNKTLQAYVNRTKEFPDYFDVLRMLEHCNRQYAYTLATFEMKRIAHDAFMKVGKLLQSRRKTDLYETVTHFTAHEKDPASVDPALQAKLSENQKKRTRISDVIEKFAREQDMLREELKEARQTKVAKRLKSESSADDEDDAIASTSANAANTAATRKIKKENGEVMSNVNRNGNDVLDDDDEYEDEDEDEEEDEDQVNGSDLEADVDKLANGNLSDVESDGEIVVNSSKDEINEASKVNDTNSVQQQTTIDKTPIATITTEEVACSSINTQSKSDETQKAQNAVTPTNATETLSQTKTSVSNNATRQKTVDPLAGAEPATTTGVKSDDDSKQAVSIANGRMKTVTQGSQSPTIKIVSLSSLKNKEDVADSSTTIVDSKQANQRDASSTKTPNKRQRTVAEIVISDEES
ncbi:PREDICTED: uncharacterized protein LOC108365374, partial [Rhagoletis zephyria]|uniref:uncharacterized protein LOC108365374 n=1 Tax=Rhagoletis zephyria TaxID=28612 RepID=UPI0008112726